MSGTQVQGDPRCPCGCGASLTGWSALGRLHGLRDGVPRVRAAAHGICGWCAQGLDQYVDCPTCGSEPRPADLRAEAGLQPFDDDRSE